MRWGRLELREGKGGSFLHIPVSFPLFRRTFLFCTKEGSSQDLVFFVSGKMEGRRGKKELGDEGGEEIYGTGGGEEGEELTTTHYLFESSLFITIFHCFEVCQNNNNFSIKNTKVCIEKRGWLLVSFPFFLFLFLFFFFLIFF